MIGCNEQTSNLRDGGGRPSWPAIAAAALALFGPGQTHGAETGVVPIPVSVSHAEGAFDFDGSIDVIAPPADAAAVGAARELTEFLSDLPRLPLRFRPGAARDGAIVLERASSRRMGREGYRLTVTPQRITIAAGDTAGWFYGGMTLWQLIHPAADAGRGRIDAQIVVDRPRFPWRGLMLDSARHFQSPEFIARLVDWMALHKLNVLHWHLTDDQGWRIEIPKYPALTAIGGFRVEAGRAAASDVDPASGRPRVYGGFYRQADIRSLVHHAALRHVMIVPEIELPGHCSAAIASYPPLGVGPGVVPVVPSDWGVYTHVYAPEESTFRFLEDVLDEVLALFPGRFIHIGGDEVVIDEWRQSPHVAERVRDLGLHSVDQLHGYFTRRIAEFLAVRGRRAVGWDEILEPGLPRSAVVMSWRGVIGARTAALQGNDTVLAPDPDLYFDHRQGSGSDEPPGRAAIVAIRDVYGFEPLPAGLSAKQRNHVLGLQANLWTEHVRTEDRAARMVFPRLAAVAEVGWSPDERRDWADFERRIATLIGRYRRLGVPFDESLFGVTGTPAYGADHQTATVTLMRQADYGVIRYTTDGSQPGPESLAYHEPITVKLPAELRAASFAGDDRLSSPLVLPVSADLAGRRTSHELRLCSKSVALALEDDAPLSGQRALFLIDIENPCWIYPSTDLDRIATITAAVGQVPFNFQIGGDRAKMRFARPVTADGELEVRIDTCDGDLYARLPLAAAVSSDAVTVLPPQAVARRSGRHELCIRFAQSEVDPLWALDWIDLRPAPVSP